MMTIHRSAISIRLEDGLPQPSNSMKEMLLSVEWTSIKIGTRITTLD